MLGKDVKKLLLPRVSTILVIGIFSYVVTCHARLFGNVQNDPPPHIHNQQQQQQQQQYPHRHLPFQQQQQEQQQQPPQRGGVLFGRAEREERPPPRGGPVGTGLPPQNILGQFQRAKPETDEDESDPRNPPKKGRMRLGPILFDPEHLVYDDNDDYSEEDESDPEKTVVRPKFGFDILSLFVPVSNFFSVICRLFYTFISKMEKRFNLFLGREHQDGQTSVLFVITITWFIFGTIYVIVNMIVNRIMREPEENGPDRESNLNNTFLKLSGQMPTVQTTPPTPTSTGTEIDGIEPKRRRIESPKNFSRQFRKPSMKDIQKRPTSSTWLSGVGLSRPTESRILRRQEREKVLSSKTSVLGQFERRVISDDISTSTISQVDDILSELTQDRFTLEKFKTIWLSQVNVNTSKNMIKAFSTSQVAQVPSAEMVLIKDFKFPCLSKVEINSTTDSDLLKIDFEMSVGFTIGVKLCTPLECDKVDASMVIDYLRTKVELELSKNFKPYSTNSFKWRQTGFVDVRLHWEGVEPGNEALVDVSEEAILDAVRNTEIERSLSDVLYVEVPSISDERDVMEILDVTVIRTSNLEIGRTNGKANNSESKFSCAWRYFVVVEADEPQGRFLSDSDSAHVVEDSGDVIWKQCNFKIPVKRSVTQELLIEVWCSPVCENGDSKDSKPVFIGMCLFSVNDLISTTPSQTRIVSLQKRPFEVEPETTSQTLMTILFQYCPNNLGSIEDTPALMLRGVHKISETRRAVAPGGHVVRTASITYLMTHHGQNRGNKASPVAKNGSVGHRVIQETFHDNSDKSHVEKVNGVAQAALNDIELMRSQPRSGNAIERTTLIIRSVQKICTSNPGSTNGDYNSQDLEQIEDSEMTCDKTEDENEVPAALEAGHEKDFVQDEIKSKRGILSSIRKKLYNVARSPKKYKNRKKNQGEVSRPAVIAEDEDSLSSCSDCSSERSFELSDWKGKLSISWESLSSEPGATVSLLTPNHGGNNNGDDASSLSDVSGVSVSSVLGRSGVFEEASSSNSESAAPASTSTVASALVLETVEHGIKRHYLIPQQMMKKGSVKLKKKGRKLHLCLDHVFVARHVKGGPSCSVCRRRIVVRLGKQGYVCRGCDLTCHKSCHQKVDQACSKSTISSMEL